MSALPTFLESKEFYKLITKGKDQTFLTPEEINDAIPASIVDVHSVDNILEKVKSAGIDIQNFESEEEEEGIRLDGTEIIEETLSREEKAELKSPQQILSNFI